ncbi:MAG: hypothetical protein U5L45_16005 [Saprospiraceae bacterium]|nr:hypothetical protein [Saprospiraceae bacterium]
MTTSISSNGIAPNRGSESPSKTIARQVVALFLNRTSTFVTTSISTILPSAVSAFLFSANGNCNCS